MPCFTQIEIWNFEILDQEKNWLLLLIVVGFNQPLYFIFVYFWFRITYWKCAHKCICRVVISVDFKTHVFEVFCAILRITLVDDVSVTHQDEFVEVFEGLGRRLVDCCTDCFAMLSCNFFKNFADLYCCEAVKSWCWFIKQNDPWISNELYLPAYWQDRGTRGADCATRRSQGQPVVGSEGVLLGAVRHPALCTRRHSWWFRDQFQWCTCEA